MDLLGEEGVESVKSRRANFQVVFVVVKELGYDIESVLHELRVRQDRGRE